LLEARSVSVTAVSRPLLTGASLRIERGTLAWVEGPSGSGKSTLLRTLARLVACHGGLSLGGAPAAQLHPHEWRRRVGLLPQPIVPLGRTIREDLLAPFSLKVRRGQQEPSVSALEGELSALGLAELGLDRPTAQLSQGQLARVAVLRTILAGPEVLLLDEPTANLDPAAARLVAARVLLFVGGGGAAVVAGHGSPWAGVDRRFRVEGGALLQVQP